MRIQPGNVDGLPQRDRNTAHGIKSPTRSARRTAWSRSSKVVQPSPGPSTRNVASRAATPGHRLKRGSGRLTPVRSSSATTRAPLGSVCSNRAGQHTGHGGTKVKPATPNATAVRKMSGTPRPNSTSGSISRRRNIIMSLPSMPEEPEGPSPSAPRSQQTRSYHHTRGPVSPLMEMASNASSPLPTPNQRLEFSSETSTMGSPRTDQYALESNLSTAGKCRVLEDKYPKWAAWQKQSLDEQQRLATELAMVKQQRDLLANKLERQQAMTQMFVMATKRRSAKSAQRQSATASTSASSASGSSLASSAVNYSLANSRSVLVESLLQRESSSSDGLDLDVSLSPEEQKQLWREYKELSGELEAMSELVGVVKQSLSALADEKDHLRQQLDGRNQLVAELLHPRDGGAAELSQLIMAMQRKMAMQDELRRNQSDDDSIVSIDQSFIIDRLQHLVGADPAAARGLQGGSHSGGRAHSHASSRLSVTQSARQSPCIHCRLPVSGDCGQAVPPVGLVHDTCFRCSAFGCGTHLQAGKYTVRDSQLYCPQHATAPACAPTKLCSV
eukprot:m.177283 g.177283  ORF g.177283 m.177283 type:complete len:558 (+) comp14318_c0_seq1:339-2012(+)